MTWCAYHKREFEPQRRIIQGKGQLATSLIEMPYPKRRSRFTLLVFPARFRVTCPRPVMGYRHQPCKFSAGALGTLHQFLSLKSPHTPKREAASIQSRAKLGTAKLSTLLRSRLSTSKHGGQPLGVWRFEQPHLCPCMC